MNWQQLNPWNWFKHEGNNHNTDSQIPVKRAANEQAMPTTGQRFSHPMLQLHSDINRVFDEVFGRNGISPFSDDNLLSNAGSFRANLNVAADEESYQISADLPGLEESDVSIELNGDVLTISGNKEEKVEHKDKHYYRIERSYGAFHRKLALPEDANKDDIKASMKDGVLNVLISRKSVPEKETRKITIN